MEFLNKKQIKRVCLILLVGVVWLVLSDNVEAESGTKIHFISLNYMTDAILLESNGHYGMIDSGEDWDYPNSERYPFREGITVGIGYEQQVIHYLKQLGVEKLDFYIATHAHSDHIGSGDEILNYFPTERLYVSEYKDEYMYDAHGMDSNDPYYFADAQENRLWDNQYVYDQLIAAAKENGTQIITNLDYPENEKFRSFSMGDMNIEILNYERERDSEGKIIPVNSENANCLVALITAFGKTALLTSDIEPWVRNSTECGDTAKIALQLIERFGTEETSINQEIQVADSYESEIYEEQNGVVLSIPQGGANQEENKSKFIDETKVNTDKTVSIDLLKMSHHSVDYNNTTFFLTSLNPKTVVITGYESWYSARERACMPNSKVYATATDSAAVVSEFTSTGIYTGYIKIEPEWMELDGKRYYFDSNGRTYTDGKIHKIDGIEYCFDEKGAVDDRGRWVLSDDVWKYWKGGQYICSDWIETDGILYYCDAQGKMATGWQRIEGKDYYFIQDGSLAKNMWINGHYVDKNGVWIEKYSTARWIMSGTSWWYCFGNGEYPIDRWVIIDGVKYYFNIDGWMATGWQMIGKEWYYFDEGGNTVTNTWIGDYYLDGSGIWVQEKYRDKWMESQGRWWYRHSDGSYIRAKWENINGVWYYFDEEGWMAIGWQLIDDFWYYFDTNGKVVTNAWIGDCYVNESGVWDMSIYHPQWKESQGRWWYQHSDGKYTMADWEYLEGKWYYFDEEGWMVTGWYCINDKWYYMDAEGAKVTNAWIGNYYVKDDGVMATSEWVDEGRYYVDEMGIWVSM